MRILLRTLVSVAIFAPLAVVTGQDVKLLENGEKPPFSIVVSKTLDRPILWIKPSEDNLGKTPSDIVLEFLKCVQRNDAKGAKKLCSIPPKDHWPQFLEKSKLVLVSGSFQSFFNRTRSANTGSKVVLSSTPVRGKAGWWRLIYAVRDKNETGPRNRRFNLRKIDGEWKIIEPFWWGRIAANDPKEELYW